MSGHGNHGSGGDGHPAVGHVVPVWLLGAILLALLVLTYLTYMLSGVPLGAANIWVAIGIASVKATLVAMFFMHLRWDRPFNAIILVSSVLFVGLFISLAMMDTQQYQPTIYPGDAPGMQRSSSSTAGTPQAP